MRFSIRRGAGGRQRRHFSQTGISSSEIVSKIKSNQPIRQE
jgi:hypothetical protein